MEPRTIADLQRVKDDANVVAVAYGSFLAGHIVLSLVMLLYTRDKSEYARFHAIQTLVAHVAAMAALFIVIGIYVSLVLSTVAGAVAHHGGQPPLAFLGVFPLVFLFVISSLVASFVTSVVGMRRAMDLRDVTFPVIGRWVFARYFRGRRAAAAV